MLTSAALVLGTASLLTVIWYFWPQGPQVYDTVLRADRLVVYEGLPHPMYEEGAVQEELKTKPTVQLSGFPFYREPLDLSDEDVKMLRGLLGDGSTYRPYTGEKRCGGFHPDYAVEWTTEGVTYRCLICFGCDEAKFDGPQGERSLYDLRSEWQGRRRSLKLLDLLKPYRKNRPPHESFGPLVGRSLPAGAQLSRSSSYSGGSPAPVRPIQVRRIPLLPRPRGEHG